MPAGELVPGDKGVARREIANSYTHFSPRVGLAWDPFEQGKTSVRASGGIFAGEHIRQRVECIIKKLYPFSALHVAQAGLTHQPVLRRRNHDRMHVTSPFPFHLYRWGGQSDSLHRHHRRRRTQLRFDQHLPLGSASVQQQVTKTAAVSGAHHDELAEHDLRQRELLYRSTTSDRRDRQCKYARLLQYGSDYYHQRRGYSNPRYSASYMG